MGLKKAERERIAFDRKFQEGFLLVDILKNEWRLGKLIGRGGFGNVYSVVPAANNTHKDTETECFSAKIEPLSNGPLFTEIAFYQRVASQEKLKTWCATQGLQFIGIPTYVSSGSESKGVTNHRFIVLPRLGENVENVWLKMDKRFSAGTVYQLGVQLLVCLEYIHHHCYSHGDIKTSNLMTGCGDRLDCCRIYLMDFGLASAFTLAKKHKAYREDPKKKHDGTIEYTSIDAHNGVLVSRRGDLVNLAFLLLHLMMGDLPWNQHIADKEKVCLEKEKFLKDPANYTVTNYANLPPHKIPACDGLIEYTKIVSNLSYEQTPDYRKLYDILSDAEVITKQQKSNLKLGYVHIAPEIEEGSFFHKNDHSIGATQPLFASENGENNVDGRRILPSRAAKIRKM